MVGTSTCTQLNANKSLFCTIKSSTLLLSMTSERRAIGDYVFFFQYCIFTAFHSMIAGLKVCLSGHDSDNYDRTHFICSKV